MYGYHSDSNLISKKVVKMNEIWMFFKYERMNKE
jgi:hypothetical protein